MVFTLLGSVARQSRERVVTMRVHEEGGLVAVQGADRMVEVYRWRSEEEIKKKLRRRAKRGREKRARAPGDVDSGCPFRCHEGKS